MKEISRIGLTTGLICLFLFIVVQRVRGQEPPTAEPRAAETGVETMPTPDRLAPPATVIPATQADDGAQLYWLWCQPCHGDQGQGLTNEWREQYPEDHQYCWNSGCHGDIPYEDGFTLPKHVPAIIGGQSLSRFATVGELYEYVHLKMHYEFPGALNSEEALAVTAFLARSHGKLDGRLLTVGNVDQLRWRLLPTTTPLPVSADTSGPGPEALLPGKEVFLAAGLLVFLFGGAYLWTKRQ